MNDHLIRYMNFEELYSVLKNGKIRFKKPYNWPDQYESILKQIFTEQNTYLQFINYVENKFGKEKISTIIYRLYHLYSTQYVCCFTELANEDNDFMWRSFSTGQEIVRVEFDFGLDEDKATTIEIENKRFFIYKKHIDYSKEINSLKDYVNMIDLDSDSDKKTKYTYGKQLTYKRPYFINEKEVRLILATPLDEKICGLIREQKIPNDLEQLNKEIGYNEYKDTIEYPVGRECIINVKINPFSKEGFRWCVEKLCKEYAIDYIGQSKIYNFEK